MHKTILGVDYRHKGISAYMKIGGRTQKGAERSAKAVIQALRKKLPEGVHVGLPRYMGYDPKAKREVCEIPVIIAGKDDTCRAVLSELVLRGSAG